MSNFDNKQIYQKWLVTYNGYTYPYDYMVEYKLETPADEVNLIPNYLYKWGEPKLPPVADNVKWVGWGLDFFGNPVFMPDIQNNKSRWGDKTLKGFMILE